MTFKQLTKEHVNNETYFAQLEKYVSLIEETNKVMNLTGFKGDRLWEEGIYESILSLETAFNGKPGKLLDIGAGAGFPSIPYIIVHPQVKLTIYESQGKRVKFLNNVVEELGISAKINQVRVEESIESNAYDFITARAVADVNAMIKAAYHVAKDGAKFGLVKGPKYVQELIEAQEVISKLELEVNTTKVETIKTKDVFMVMFKKTTPTPKGWPLAWSEIIKKRKNK